MVRVVLFCCLFFVFATGQGIAQSNDTTYLKEVRIYGLPTTSYATGSKTEHIDAGDDVATLSDKLINETSIYLKTYGNNQLSTVSLRGTSSSQTAVLWNGVNINSPTLGQSDFSVIPLFLFDDITIRYGAASSLYGSDAIGGSIMLGTRPAIFKRQFKGTIFQQVGSFGRVSTGVKATYGNTRWELRTKAFHSFIENNFPYNSPAVGHSKEQNQASVRNYGIDQQVHFKISGTQQLDLEGMYTNNFREIQPAVTNDLSNETLRDQHLRLSLNYLNDSRIGVFAATTTYVESKQDYYDDVTSVVRSKQFTALMSVDKTLSQRASLRYGASISHYGATSQNFEGPISENRYDGFVSFRYALLPFWILNINLRQSIYTNRYAPFAPTAGTEYHILRNENNKLLVRAQVARGYRVPTLNDRYWVPGGNPNVTPEDALHVEGGANWTRTWSALKFVVDAAVYRSWINEMIVWLPVDNIWSPTNLQKVNIYGGEITTSAVFTEARYKITGTVLYSYTRSINENSPSGLTNKQLAYVPVHSGRASASLATRTWEFNVRLNATGLRYTSLNNVSSQALDPYGLMDASISKKFLFENLSFQLSGEVNNIFNVYYENLQNHAMPGTNYALTLHLNFNNQ